MVNYTGKKVTIFGGGKVGARKARYFADEADVTVYSRSFNSDFQTIPVKQIKKDVSREDSNLSTLIEGASLVIAATSDPVLNSSILTSCKRQGILCNNATEPPGDVSLPAKFTGEQFTIAVSTRGGSPAVARFIREHIQATWPNLDQMIILEDQLRSDLKEQGIPEDRRREILTAVLHDPEIWQALKTGLPEANRLVAQRYQS
ncbi:MAG: bifunctional precorrin-2 dehydrogenase/sirohydrochlorin ferrochelatase [Methanobacteriota archaeon]